MKVLPHLYTHLRESFLKAKIDLQRYSQKSLRSDCLLCGDNLFDQYFYGGVDLCAPCRSQLRFNLACCERCALPLHEAKPALYAEKIVCGACQTKPPSWQKSIVSLKYVYPLDRMLIALKYNGRVDMAGSLARLMCQDILMNYRFDQAEGARPDCLLAVPLHPFREAQRGYNQAELLAKEISNTLNIPLELDLLNRSRHTPRQSSLSKQQRALNLHQAFAIRKKSVLPKYVAIIDDVMTTGSTAEAITKTLLNAGVKRVDVWCCARAE